MKIEDVANLVVMAVHFLGRPGGVCIRTSRLFSWFMCCLPINNFLCPMTTDAIITAPACMVVYYSHSYQLS